MIRSKREIRKRELNTLIADLSIKLQRAEAELKNIKEREYEEMSAYLKPSIEKPPEKLGKIKI